MMNNTEKIQIVHFVENLGKGGLENVIYNNVTNLDINKFKVSVICRIEGGYTANKLKKKGIKVLELNKKKIGMIKLKRSLSEFRSCKNAILHCHGLFATSSEAIIGRFSGYKSVFVHVHNLEKPEKLKQWLKLKILKSQVNKFIAVSNAVSNCLRKNSIQNIMIIPNSVSIQKYKFRNISSKDKLNFPLDSFLLGMVGRIVERKGFKEFIKIIEKIKRINGLIVGEGDYENEVKSIVKKKNLENKIKFLPFQSQDKLPDIYAKLDGIFLFSLKEGLPLAILEAQSVGVPFIGNDVGGIKELIKDNYNGFIIQDTNVDRINEIINKISGNPEYYRTNARRVIEAKFSINSMIKNLESLYLSSVK